ncbi:hypothetical protein T484DRAFT_1918762 [Baffinella frigidus]|nr:hypothetical protein T484DRAFT_1918762 [Cryptophyta sp. CCMP2293]
MTESCLQPPSLRTTTAVTDFAELKRFGIMEMMVTPPSELASFKEVHFLPARAWNTCGDTESEDSEIMSDGDELTPSLTSRLMASHPSPLKDHDDTLARAARPRRGAAGGSKRLKMQSSY